MSNAAHRCFLSGFFLAAAIGLLGCGARDAQLGSSDLKHNLDEPTRGSHAGMWIELSDQQYSSVLLSAVGMDQTAVLPADDVLTKRMQFWLDELDTSIRGAHPDQLVNVPRPRAKVVGQGSANAFVAGVPVCYSVGLDLAADAAGLRSAAADMMFLDLRTGELTPVPAGSLPCVERATETKNLEELLAYFNAHSPACQYEFENGRIAANSACAESNAERLEGYGSARKVAVLQTANTVTIHSGIISLMTEEALLGVLAHELGHYYRAHLNAPSALYNFFYTLGQRNAEQKPEADSNLLELGQRAIAASTALAQFDVFATLPEQRLNSELYLAASSLVADVCEKGQCTAACNKAYTTLHDPAYDKAIGSFPFVRSLDEAGKELYKRFEVETLACFESVSVTSAGVGASSQAASWKHIQNRVQSPRLPRWFPAKKSKVIISLGSWTHKRLQTFQYQPGSLADLFIAISQHLTNVDNVHVKVLKQAHEQHLGYYTDEQEADELAVEWTAKIGRDPKYVIDAMRALQSGTLDSHSGFDYGKDYCEQLYAKNWLDDEGRYLFVPIGNYTDTHHGLCYRMFNMGREIETHGIAAAHKSEVKSPGLMSWSTLQAKAEQISKSSEEHFGSSRGATFGSVLAESYLSKCPYSHGLTK